MLPASEQWFTEACIPGGSAFSFTITAKLHEEQSPFQKIEVYATREYGNLMVIDGYVMLTTRDNFLYHEMMSHPVIYTHPNPEKVLIIGGGDCGTLREVLRHPSIKHVDQVDIDEGVTRAALEYFPELCESNDDPRAHIYFDDGLKWVKEAEVDSYDIIIVDSTDPVGPAEGLFGKAFYQDCFKLVGKNGIVVQQSESPLIHQQLICEMHEAMRDAGFTQRRTLHFPQPVYPTGWWSCTMASSMDLNEFRKPALDFPTLYYTHNVHAGGRALPPYLQKQLDAI